MTEKAKRRLNSGRFPLLCKTADYEILLEDLDIVSLVIVEETLNNYFNGNIDMIVPRTENDEPDFYGEFELIINDNNYIENGYELLIMKWIDDFESTDYLIYSFNFGLAKINDEIVFCKDEFEDLFIKLLDICFAQVELTIRFYGDILGQDFDDDIVSDKADEIISNKLGITENELDKILHGEYKIKMGHRRFVNSSH